MRPRLVLPLLSAALLAALACGGLPVPDTGVSGPVPTPPETPKLPPPSGVVAADCMGLCQHTAECWSSSGRPLGADEQDCASSCQQPTGSYVHMGPVNWVCATTACGQPFDDCSGNGMVALLQAGLSGGPLDPPAEWPAGFPMFYGGIPMPTPQAGPLKTYAMVFPMPPPDLATAVRAEVVRTGWTITSDEAAAEQNTSDHVRLHTEKAGATVDVSIYGLEGQTVLQLIY